MDNKARFEAWARKACNMPDHAAINYDAPWTQAALEGWNGALAEVAAPPAPATECTAQETPAAAAERQAAEVNFDSQVVLTPSIVSPMTGWTVRQAFVRGWETRAKRGIQALLQAITAGKVKQAREALDNMDDYARMETGVNAIGPRGVLETFISDVEKAIAGAGPSQARSNRSSRPAKKSKKR